MAVVELIAVPPSERGQLKREEPDLFSVPSQLGDSAPMRSGALLLFALGTVCFSAGCGTTDVKDMDAVEKAKLVKKLREEGEYQYSLIVKSENDPSGFNEDALFKYADVWKRVTEIVSPNDYPLAYANYGAALSMVGRHYSTLAVVFEKEIKTKPAGEQAELQAKIDKYTAEAAKSFARANRQFDIYIQTPQSTLDARVYRWAIQNAESLKDWRGALSYLEFFEASGELTAEAHKQIAQLRREYQENLRLTEEKELEEELRDGNSGTRDRGPAPHVRAENAN